jgi:hypothetical protein
MIDLPPCFVFDVDGTLALHVARDPYQWREADADRPNHPVIAALRALHKVGYAVVYISGRPEEARQLTLTWIDREIGVAGPLFMRPDRDFRKDADVKFEIYFRDIAPKFQAIAVFDDRDQVVRMWRDQAKVVCFQVAQGTF